MVYGAEEVWFTPEHLWQLIAFSMGEHHNQIVQAVVASNWETESVQAEIAESKDDLAILHLSINAGLAEKADEIAEFMLTGGILDLQVGFRKVFIHLDHFRSVDRPKNTD